MNLRSTFSALAISLAATSCNNAPTGNTHSSSSDSGVTGASAGSASQAGIKTENVSYTSGTTHSISYAAYDENKKGKRPVVLVIPEWWGLNDYVKGRARQLAELGYFALAVDMYGDGKNAADPKEAGNLATPFYKNPQLAENMVSAAAAALKSYPQADSAQMAVIGYCFGGTAALNSARLGFPAKGIVSFHGGLAGPAPAKGAIKSDILVCHGAADKFVSPQEVAAFKKQMDSVGAHYTFKEYAGATHAFSNPQATEWGKKFNMPIAYNEAADKSSWNEMKTFFHQIFR